MPAITSQEHQDLAQNMKQNYSLYQQNKDLIAIGAYNKGSDARIDQAINLLPVIKFYLQQKMKEVIPYDQSLSQLQEIIAAAHAHNNRGQNGS